jgi:hypothetical protein
MLKQGIAIATTSLCLVGASACHRPEGIRGSSGTNTDTAKPVHPSVPGRNIPCPGEGGLDKSGYPCEPPAASAAAKSQ